MNVTFEETMETIKKMGIKFLVGASLAVCMIYVCPVLVYTVFGIIAAAIAAAICGIMTLWVGSIIVYKFYYRYIKELLA